MILTKTDIMNLWEDKKHKLKEYFETHNILEYKDYTTLLKKTLEIVFSGSDNDIDFIPNYESMTVINDGDYQGTLLFIIPLNCYEPSVYDYWWTAVDYGSCAACDTLESLVNYNYEKPSKEQVEGFMTLCMHLIQKLKPLADI